MEKVEEVKKRLADGENPRNLKMELAFEFVKMVHGEDSANQAQEYFVKTVQNKEVPDEVETKSIKVGRIGIVDLLNEFGLAASKGEARRLIKQNGIKVDGEVVSDENMELEIGKKEILLQRGKRQFLKVVGK